MSTTPTPFAANATDYKIPDKVMSKINEIASQYPEKNSAMLPALHLIQDEFGWIPPSAVRQLADALDTTPNKVYAVVSFYTMFNQAPVGKYHIQVCRNVSCSLLGSKHIVDHLTSKLGIQPGQTTENKKFTLSLVECLGACGTAPVMMINDTYYENLTSGKVDEILNTLA
ncbi:NADH-quinone oxidoreductase subunit NuoE [candidate division KSB1 bacterium]|nr:NADH-quinone oxidoreductase subunit NuoE [candidate division KSB1 bacterium]